MHAFVRLIANHIFYAYTWYFLQMQCKRNFITGIWTHYNFLNGTIIILNIPLNKISKKYIMLSFFIHFLKK